MCNHDVLKFRDLMKISKEMVLSWGHEKVLNNWSGQHEAKTKCQNLIMLWAWAQTMAKAC